MKVPICIAFNDPVRATRMELVLVEDGYEVYTFASAKQVWQSFELRRPRYIITDWNFRDDFTGLDLCRQVRQHHPSPYVYLHILGQKHHLPEIEEALNSGANDYSVKPISPFQLRARVCVGMRWLQYLDSLSVGPSQQSQSA